MTWTLTGSDKKWRTRSVIWAWKLDYLVSLINVYDYPRLLSDTWHTWQKLRQEKRPTTQTKLRRKGLLSWFENSLSGIIKELTTMTAKQTVSKNTQRILRLFSRLLSVAARSPDMLTWLNMFISSKLSQLLVLSFLRSLRFVSIVLVSLGAWNYGFIRFIKAEKRAENQPILSAVEVEGF